MGLAPLASGRVRGLILCVSPYLVSAKDPALIVGAQFASGLVTLMPVPDSGESLDDVRAAATASRSYDRLLQSWSWAMPLFHAGLLGSVHDGLDPLDHVRACVARLNAEGTMRGLLNDRFLGESSDASLEAVASDILKGGSDPGVSVPVCSGLDEFAAGLELWSLRGEGGGISQRTELERASARFRVAVPCLVRAHAERLIEARAELDPWLAEVREAMDAGDVSGTRAAAGAYADRFAKVEAQLTRPDPEEPPVVAGTAALSVLDSDAEAGLRSSVAAARAYLQAEGAGQAGGPRTSTERVPLTLLHVRVMGGGSRGASRSLGRSSGRSGL